MISKEENYHVQQIKGVVSFEQGGCGDLWTVDGVKWWISYVGSASSIPYYGNTADEAKNNANNSIMQALTTEDNVCNDLYKKRRALMESRAK